MEATGWTPPHLIRIDVPDWKSHPPVNREKESTVRLIRVRVDLAKSVFQVHGVDRSKEAVWRRKLTREDWLKVLLEPIEPGCAIGMESCGGAHHWARRLQGRGFAVRLIAPQFVAPCATSNKNDADDTEAICEAMCRPHMRIASAKTVEQQDIQAVHRIRAELRKHRTAKGNQARGLLAGYGLAAPKELLHLRRGLPCWLQDFENGLSERFRRLLNGLWGDLRRLDERMTELDREFAVIARCDPAAKRLQRLPGVGPITATALSAAVGNGDQFANGRQMSAAFGLAPRQRSPCTAILSDCRTACAAQRSIRRLRLPPRGELHYQRRCARRVRRQREPRRNPRLRTLGV
jgi:transposase